MKHLLALHKWTGSHVIVTCFALTVLGFFFSIIFVSLLLDDWLEAKRLKYERLPLMRELKRQAPRTVTGLTGRESDLMRLNPDLIRRTRSSL